MAVVIVPRRGLHRAPPSGHARSRAKAGIPGTTPPHPAVNHRHLVQRLRGIQLAEGAGYEIGAVQRVEAVPLGAPSQAAAEAHMLAMMVAGSHPAVAVVPRSDPELLRLSLLRLY